MQMDEFDTLAGRWAWIARGPWSEMDQEAKDALMTMFYTGAYAAYRLMLDIPRMDRPMERMRGLQDELDSFLNELAAAARRAALRQESN